MRVERICDQHNVADFTSGNKELDNWIQQHGLEHDGRDVARVYVLLDDSEAIVGYVTVSMMSECQDGLPTKLGSGLAGLEVPGVLIGRLAVHSARQGSGMGRDLLVFAVNQAIEGAHAIAARFIAVDPIDDAARAFYAHNGFNDVPSDPGGRMFLSLKQARHAFE